MLPRAQMSHSLHSTYGNFCIYILYCKKESENERYGISFCAAVNVEYLIPPRKPLYELETL